MPHQEKVTWLGVAGQRDVIVNAALAAVVGAEVLHYGAAVRSYRRGRHD